MESTESFEESLTPAERRVWRAFPRGEVVDFRPPGARGAGGGRAEPARVAGAPAGPAENGDSWGANRTVRASVLRKLLLTGAAADGEIAALRVVGARITGVLDLQYATVEYAIRLWGCHFDQAPVLYGARLRQLNLSESFLPAVQAATVHVDGVLRITDCRIPGAVRLGGAKISGAFFCDRARLGPAAPARPGGEPHGEPGSEPHGATGGDTGNERDGDTGSEAGAAPETRSPVRSDPVLELNHATLEDDVWGPGMVVTGGVRMTGATIAGALNLEDARVHAPGGVAIDAETLSVGNNVRGAGLEVRGRVELRGARVPGRVLLAGARLSNPGGTALRASSAVIGELWLGRTRPIAGTVNLRRSQVDILDIRPETAPGTVLLNGLTYSGLAPHLPAEERLPLLERDGDGHVPYAYEQLTTAYRKVGDDAAARTVQLAKLRRHRATLPGYARVWGHLQDVTVGYGYRPLRAAAWLGTLLVVGTIAYGTHNPPAAKPDEAPPFNALFYALDLLLPIIDFGQESAFRPAGWHQWLAYLFILAGWILATTVAAGITRSINHQ